MANENKNNENKNNVVANPAMTNGQMEQFVKDNISIVPKNQTKKFESLKLEQKVSKIRFYIDIQKMKEDAREKPIMASALHEPTSGMCSTNSTVAKRQRTRPSLVSDLD